LKAKFEPIGRVKSVTVSRRRDKADPTRALSMGFGFVQFYRQADAQRAIKELQVNEAP
jgi:multiple RNA-binding domain-containing protein 1